MKTVKLILLRKVKYGEADLVVSGITSEGLKISFMARSALRSRKRFGGGVLEPTHYISASYNESRSSSSGGGLHSLSEASVINEFLQLKKDYDRIQLALHMVGMIDRLSKEGDMDLKGLFDLLGNSLAAAEKSSHLGKLRTHFEVKLMANLGIMPQWDQVTPFLERPVREHESVVASIDNVEMFSERVHRYIEDQLNVRLR